MKKTTFFLFTIFAIITQIFAQKTEYRSIFDNSDNFSYNVLYSYHDNVAYVCEMTLSFHFYGDTIINGVEYKDFRVYVGNLFEDYYTRYLLRESEDHSKLYTLQYRYPEIAEDVLVMDLDLNLHDTFNYSCTYQNYNLIVENIFYDEHNLKHILFSPVKHNIEYGDSSDYQFEFIEGTGTTAIFGLEGRLGLLLCTYQDDTNIFTNNSNYLPAHIKDKCYYEHWHLGVEDIFTDKNNIKISPNPTNDIVYIQTENGTTPELKLYSLDGRLLQQLRNMEIDLSTYSAGIYLLNIDGETVKILKK